MKITPHSIDSSIAEITSDELIISTIDEGLNLLGTLYFDGFDKVIIYKENITPHFFDLSSGMAGEILQKFSNYRVKLAIVGDFKVNISKSLQEFIAESNKMGQVFFVDSRGRALEQFSK